VRVRDLLGLAYRRSCAIATADGIAHEDVDEDVDEDEDEDEDES
jgi:hypothetical protein